MIAAMKRVVMIGLLPSVVDLSSFPGLTREKLAASLQREEQSLRDLGFDASWVLTDLGETAEAVVRAKLDEKPCDVVLIGAGVRTVPAYFLLFERLLNIVHERAPGAKICFNTRPDDTREAVLRWIEAPSA
jgi:hypothetical protein